MSLTGPWKAVTESTCEDKRPKITAGPVIACESSSAAVTNGVAAFA